MANVNKRKREQNLNVCLVVALLMTTVTNNTKYKCTIFERVTVKYTGTARNLSENAKSTIERKVTEYDNNMYVNIRMLRSTKNIYIFSETISFITNSQCFKKTSLLI